MSRLRKLQMLTSVTLALGVFAVVYVLAASLGPSDKAKLNEVRLRLSEVEIGEYLEIDAYGMHAFVLRFGGDDFKVFAIPRHWEAEYALPDLTWRRAYFPCNDFGVVGSLDDSSDTESLFTCRDSDRQEMSWKRLAWAANGSSRSEYAPSLQQFEWSIEKGWLIIHPRVLG